LDTVKALKYEIRRIASSKVYLAIAALAVVFAGYSLQTRVIFGTAYTAPFSQWSYAGFLCDMHPLLLLSLTFFCGGIFSRKELLVKTILRAAPRTDTWYYGIKGLAALLTWLISALFPLLYSLIFYARVFRFYHFERFIAPILLFFIPPALLVMGLAMLLGRIRGWLTYLIIPVILLGSSLESGVFPWLSPFGRAIASQYPLLLQVDGAGEAAFTLPDGMALSRIVFSLAGLVMFALACRPEKRTKVNRRHES